MTSEMDKPGARISGRKGWMIYGILLGIQMVLYVALFWPGYGQPHVLRFILIAIGASVLWLLTLYFLGARSRSCRIKYSILLVGLIAGALFRAICFAGAGEQTYLSDDVYRYVWDGRLLHHGLNPFAIAPDDANYNPLVAPLADDYIYPKINHPSFPSIYPPVSQALFFLADTVSDSTVYGFKIVSLLFELLTLLTMATLLKAYNLPRWYLLLYWLAPLPILEFSLSAHHDLLLLPFLTLVLLFQRRKQVVATALFLVLASLTKFIVALAIPALSLSFVGRDRLKFALTVIVTTALIYAPFWFWLEPRGLFGSLMDYLSQWQYNGSLYTLTERGISLVSEHSATIARGFVSLLLGITIGVATVRFKDKVQAAYVCLLAYTALTTTLFPWYLVVFFPFLLLYRGQAIMSLMALVWLSYWGLIGQLDTGFWYDNWWLRTLQYVPFYILLTLSFKHNLLAQRKSHQEESQQQGSQYCAI